MSENDPTNLSLYEAFYIRKHNLPSIPLRNVENSRTFCLRVFKYFRDYFLEFQETFT